MRHILNLGCVVALPVLLFTAGCISVQSSPSSRFYALQSFKEANVPVSDVDALTNLTVGIGPVSLPEYCNRPQIVTRNSDDSLNFAQFDRWAEPLDKAMARTISHNLALLLPRINVETFPWNSIMPVKYQVIMNTLQLDCRLDKQVVLFMQWSILDAQSKKKLFDKRSDYRIPVGTHNYSDLVQAINVICESLSKEIAQALTEVVGKGPA